MAFIREYGIAEGVNTRHYMASSDYPAESYPTALNCEVGSDLTIVDEATHAETGYKRFDGENWNTVGG